MGHSGPWVLMRAFASPPASRGEEGRPRKTPDPRDTVPQALRRFTAEPLGYRDFAAGGAVVFEPKPRPPAAVTLAAAPALLPGSPDFPRRRSQGTPQDRGALWTLARPSLTPRGLPPPSPHSPCPEREERGAAGSWAESLLRPASRAAPGRGGAGPGRGGGQHDRPAPLGTHPEPRHAAHGEPGRRTNLTTKAQEDGNTVFMPI